jgi:hypothetical protein
LLFALTVLLSASLVFLVQPMLARVLLPYFGGGAQIWTASLLFFQTALLGGYFYAYLLSRYASLRQQRIWHSTLLLLALLSLFVIELQPDASTAPLWGILSFLTLAIGLPYVLLSATAPLVQHWFAARYPQQSPYRLYALSNLGSFGALLSYPFLLEPYIALPQQQTLWTAGFALFSLGMLAILWQVLAKTSLQPVAALQLTRRHAARYLALSAAGVVLLLAVTQQLTQNVPPVPFLWVVPLALYLLSFTLVFNRDSWYQRAIWLYLFGISLVIALLLFYLGRQFDWLSQLLLYLMLLFSGCMLCHGELARSKPVSQELTAFYLLLAAGGVLGGLMVNLLAPLLFSRYWEFPLVLLAILWLVTLSDWRRQAWWRTASSVLAGLLFMGSFMLIEQQLGRQDLSSTRNFYGSLIVRDVELNGHWQRQLIDGTTSHGAQYLDSDKAQQPLTYYRAGTGVALALQHFLPADLTRTSEQLGKRRFGLVGLGAGALAAYARAGDELEFYELNPAVMQAAQQHFSYLAQSQGEIRLHLGDARQVLLRQLAEQGSQQFDVLVLDAFSSDAIPQHLLTTEAMQLYWQHLLPDGVLAVHISNNYLDLSSILRNQATAAGLDAVFIPTAADADNPAATEWVLLSRNQRFLQQAVIQQASRPWPRPLQPEVRWTDQHSNLFQLLK